MMHYPTKILKSKTKFTLTALTIEKELKPPIAFEFNLTSSKFLCKSAIDYKNSAHEVVALRESITIGTF